MLPKIASLRSEFPRGVRWSLILFGMAALALPTWHQQAQSQDAPAVQPKSDDKPKSDAAEKPKGDSVEKPKSDSVEKPKPADPNAVLPRPVHPMPNVKRPALPPMAPPTVEFLPQPVGAEKHINTALDEIMDFDFNKESLEGVMAKIAAQHDIQIVIDGVKLEEESIPTAAKDLTLKLAGVSLRSGLNLLLRQRGLTFLIEDEVLKVTTRTVALNKRPTRTYPVRDLVGNVDVDYLLLSQTIQQSTGGPPDDPWMEADGEGGSVCVFPSTGCLVIRQTQEGHEEILKLLRSLRKANAEMKVKE